MRIHGIIVECTDRTPEGKETPSRLTVTGEVIGSVATADRGPAQTAADLNGFLLPGLVDMHCHIGLGIDGPVSDDATRAQARQDVASGVLAVRDAGSPRSTRFLEGDPWAPRIIRAGRHIARPKRYLRGYAIELDDVSALPQVVAEQALAGDGWVKLVGDWIDRSSSGDLEPLWPGDVLSDAVAAAHENGARVTVHTFATETIDALLDAGVDCIEHGTGLRPEHMQHLAAHGIPVVPTLMQVGNFAGFAAQAGQRFPSFGARMQRMYERRYEHVRALATHGVTLLMGSDAGGTIAHGTLAGEVSEWKVAGIDDAHIVDSMTWLPRKFLGLGVIEEGAPADLLVLDEDPRQDAMSVFRPQAVVHRGAKLGLGV